MSGLKMPKGLSKSAARKALDSGKVNGKPISAQQRTFFQMVAEGKAPMRLNDISASSRKRFSSQVAA